MAKQVMRDIFRIAGVVGGVVTGIVSLPASAENDNFSEFVNLNCSNLERLLPNDISEKDSVDRFVSSAVVTTALRYLLDDDSLLTDYYKPLKERQFVSGRPYSNQMEDLKLKIISKEQRRYIQALRINLEESYGADYRKYWNKESPYLIYSYNSARCKIKRLAEGSKLSVFKNIEEIVLGSANKAREARVGYFDVKINSCSAQVLPITYNKHTEPKQWEGSRFVVINTVFKNQDSEGRLPSAGSLIINYQGRELRYDTTETILQEGYGIYFKSVNPLVSMPTKIVYRIPSEVSGEVSWEPGRNSDGTRLWCTFVSAEAH